MDLAALLYAVNDALRAVAEEVAAAMRALGSGPRNRDHTHSRQRRPLGQRNRAVKRTLAVVTLLATAHGCVFNEEQQAMNKQRADQCDAAQRKLIPLVKASNQIFLFRPDLFPALLVEACNAWLLMDDQCYENFYWHGGAGNIRHFQETTDALLSNCPKQRRVTSRDYTVPRDGNDEIRSQPPL